MAEKEKMKESEELKDESKVETQKEEKKEVKSKAPKEEKKTKEESKVEESKDSPKEKTEEEPEENKGESGVEEQIKTPKPEQKKQDFTAVAHVYSSKNNVVVHVTDLSGAETLSIATGGTVVKSGREERTPFAGAQAAKKVAMDLRDKGVRRLDILLRGKGGHSGQKRPGRAASAVIKSFARMGLKIRKIEDVTPIPHGGSTPPGGKRGRRV